jgi:hypothetical protein
MDLVPIFISRTREETGLECFLELPQQWLGQRPVHLRQVGGKGRETILLASFSCDNGPNYISGTLSASSVSGSTCMSASSRNFSDSSRSERLLWLGGSVGRELEKAESMMDALKKINGAREVEGKEGRSADAGLFIAIQPRVSASQDAETQVLPAQPQPTR